MKRLPSHCAQRKTSVSVVPVDVVTSKLRQQPPNNARGWDHPNCQPLPCTGPGGWWVLFCFLKQWLPEQKADLCSRQSWGPPRARGCSPIWCHTITNKNNNKESCTHFARYGVLKVTQYEAIIPKWQFYLKITFKLKWAFQGLLLKSDMGCSGAHCHFVSCHMLPPAKWAQFAFTLYPDS